jgi:hypothetical protein
MQENQESTLQPDSVNSPGQIPGASRNDLANESCFGVGWLIGPKWTQIPGSGFGQVIENNGRPEWIRTIDLFRVKEAL